MTVTKEEERAESVIRAGQAVEARSWSCAGGDETQTIPVVYPDGRLGRPAGIHGTLVLVDDDGRAGEPVDVWVHPTAKCVAKLVGLLKGKGADPTPEPAEDSVPTPLRRRVEKVDEAPPAEASAGS